MAVSNRKTTPAHKKVPKGPEEIPFTQEQFEKLSDIRLRLDGVRRLLDAANFRNCECESEVASARLIAREIDDSMHTLWAEVQDAFGDRSLEGGIR